MTELLSLLRITNFNLANLMEDSILVQLCANIDGRQMDCHKDKAMKMAERIRRARRKAGLSQATLAEKLQVRRSAVSNWESVNDIQPAMQNLIALAKACGISFEWLGTGRGKMSPDEDLLAEIPTAHAELVEAPLERELLAMFRELPRKPQQLVVELVETLHASRRRSRRAGIGFKAEFRAR